MKINTKYTSVESVTFELDVDDLKRAVLQLVQQERLWPKLHSTADVEFGDTDDGEPYAEVIVRFEQPAESKR